MKNLTFKRVATGFILAALALCLSVLHTTSAKASSASDTRLIERDEITVIDTTIVSVDDGDAVQLETFEIDGRTFTGLPIDGHSRTAKEAAEAAMSQQFTADSQANGASPFLNLSQRQSATCNPGGFAYDQNNSGGNHWGNSELIGRSYSSGTYKCLEAEGRASAGKSNGDPDWIELNQEVCFIGAGGSITLSAPPEFTISGASSCARYDGPQVTGYNPLATEYPSIIGDNRNDEPNITVHTIEQKDSPGILANGTIYRPHTSALVTP